MPPGAVSTWAAGSLTVPMPLATIAASGPSPPARRRLCALCHRPMRGRPRPHGAHVREQTLCHRRVTPGPRPASSRAPGNPANDGYALQGWIWTEETSLNLRWTCRSRRARIDVSQLAVDFALLLIYGVLFTVASALVINRYWPLMGFWGTATCFALMAMAAIAYLIGNEAALSAAGPLVRKDPMMFKLLAIGIGAAIFLVGAILFERNYERFEERLRSRQTAVAVVPPSGPTAEEIANIVVARLSAQGSRAGIPTVPTGQQGEVTDEQVAILAQGILPRLTALITAGERLFKTVIEDPQQAGHLTSYREQIEDWRERVYKVYAELLPGAREAVLPEPLGRVSGPIGHELRRLVTSIEEQKRVVGSIETYVRRSLEANRRR